MADYSVNQGASKTITRDLRYQSYTGAVLGDWANLTVASGTVFALEADEKTEGEVDSATASTVVDATFDEADDFWNGTTLEFTSGDNEGEKREVSDFVSTGGMFTLNVLGNPLPATPAAGDDFVLLGYPIIPRTDLDGHDHGAISTQRVTFQITPADGGSSTNGVTATPGRKLLILALTWSDAGGNTDGDEFRYAIDVRPST